MTLHPFFAPRRALAVLCLLAAFSARPVRADANFGRAINIDFGTAKPVSPTYTGVGADPNDSGVIWNAAAPDPTTNTVKVANLLDSAGNATTAAVTISGVTAVSNAAGTNPTTNALLQDYLVAKTSLVTITISGLLPFTSYKIYFYGAGSQTGQGGTFHFGGESATTNGNARGSTFVQGVNYVVINGDAHESGVMTLSFSGGTLPGVMNGMQFQQSAAPITTFPSFTDLFDVSQGTVITGGSPTVAGFALAAGIGGKSPNMVEPETLLFADKNPPGTVTFFEFQMPAVQTIRSVNIFMNHDSYTVNGGPGDITARGATRVTLWAYDAATGQYDIKAYEIFPANPYALTLAPPGSAVQDSGSPYLLAVTANITPVTTDRFRMEFVQAGNDGVRFAELDGFSTLNPGLNAPVPVVTTATSTTGEVGTAFSYQLAGSNTPTSYAADGLPPGLSLLPATGVITGVPTAAGTFDAAVTATNASGPGPAATLRFDIADAAVNIQGIALLSPPADITVVQGQTIELDAAVSASAGTLARVEFVVVDSANNPTILATSTAARATTTWQPPAPGDFALVVVATDTLGQSKQFAQPIHVVSSATNAAPLISLLSGADGTQPFALGSSFEVVAAATDAAGNPLSSVQLFLDGQPIPTTISSVNPLPASTGTTSAGAGRHATDAPAGTATFAFGQIPLTGIEQLITAIVTDGQGITSVSSGLKITAKAAPTDPTTFVFTNPDGSPLTTGGTAPAVVSVAATKPSARIVKMTVFADSRSIGVATTSPFSFSLSGLAPGQHVLTAQATDGSAVSSLSAPVIVNTPALPVVTVASTVPKVTAGSGDMGEFTVSIPQALSTKLVIHYKVVGSAVAGTDYTALTGKVKIKPNHTSRTITVTPEGNPGSQKVVKVKLEAGDGYTLGATTAAKVKIEPATP